MTKIKIAILNTISFFVQKENRRNRNLFTPPPAPPLFLLLNFIPDVNLTSNIKCKVNCPTKIISIIRIKLCYQ